MQTPSQPLGILSADEISERLGRLLEDERAEAAFTAATPVVEYRCPSLRPSDHDRGCPWARSYQPSRDPAECACEHAAPFEVQP